MFQVRFLIFLALTKLILANQNIWPNGIVYYEIDTYSFNRNT